MYPSKNNSIDLRNKIRSVSKTKQIYLELQKLGSSSSLRYSINSSVPSVEVERWRSPNHDRSLTTLPPKKSLNTPSRLQEYAMQTRRETAKPYWRCPKLNAETSLKSIGPSKMKEAVKSNDSTANYITITDDDLQIDTDEDYLSNTAPPKLLSAPAAGFLESTTKEFKSVGTSTDGLPTEETVKIDEPQPHVFSFTEPVVRSPKRSFVTTAVSVVSSTQSNSMATTTTISSSPSSTVLKFPTASTASTDPQCQESLTPNRKNPRISAAQPTGNGDVGSGLSLPFSKPFIAPSIQALAVSASAVSAPAVSAPTFNLPAVSAPAMSTSAPLIFDSSAMSIAKPTGNGDLSSGLSLPFGKPFTSPSTQTPAVSAPTVNAPAVSAPAVSTSAALIFGSSAISIAQPTGNGDAGSGLSLPFSKPLTAPSIQAPAVSAPAVSTSAPLIFGTSAVSTTQPAGNSDAGSGLSFNKPFTAPSTQAPAVSTSTPLIFGNATSTFSANGFNFQSSQATGNGGVGSGFSFSKPFTAPSTQAPAATSASPMFFGNLGSTFSSRVSAPQPTGNGDVSSGLTLPFSKPFTAPSTQASAVSTSAPLIFGISAVSTTQPAGNSDAGSGLSFNKPFTAPSTQAPAVSTSTPLIFGNATSTFSANGFNFQSSQATGNGGVGSGFSFSKPFTAPSTQAPAATSASPMFFGNLGSTFSSSSQAAPSSENGSVNMFAPEPSRTRKVLTARRMRQRK